MTFMSGLQEPNWSGNSCSTVSPLLPHHVISAQRLLCGWSSSSHLPFFDHIATCISIQGPNDANADNDICPYVHHAFKELR